MPETPGPTKLVIHDSTGNDILFPKRFGRGYDPGQRTRDEGMIPKVEIVPHPSGDREKARILVGPVPNLKGMGRRGPALMGAAPKEFSIIPKSEWDARFDEMQKRKTGLRHIRKQMANGKQHKSYDQNGQGFCWAYSTGGAITYKRGAANDPYYRLSPHAVACKIKNFRDEGGWCGLSMKWAIEKGYPTVKEWPEKSMNRQYDTADTWNVAKKFRPTEYCFDTGRQVYDQEMSELLIATFLFLNMPLALDFNWWSHSVCGIEWTRIEKGSWGPTIHNSWTDSWGDEGLSTLQGSKGQADNAVGVCEIVAAA